MKLALLIAVSMLTAVKTAAVANCNSGTATMYCTSCGVTDCTRCFGGYINLGTCSAPTIPVTNCLEYSSSSQCSTCNTGFYLSGNACIANPTVGSGPFVEGCGRYELNDQLTVVCTACSSGEPLNGESADGKSRVAQCSQTFGSHPANCGLSYPVSFESLRRRILANGSLRNLSVTNVSGKACYVCQGTFVLNIDDNTCGPSDFGIHSAGCIQHQTDVCKLCNPTAYQMVEPGKCSVKPSAGPPPGPDPAPAPAPAPASSTTPAVTAIPTVGYSRLMSLLSFTSTLLLLIF